MDPVLKLIIALCFAVLFTVAALHKMRGKALFRDQLAAYGLLPERLIKPAAFLMPLVEIALAASLLIPALTTLALYGSAAMLIFYAGVMELALLRGRANIDCGCSGANGATSISGALVVRNLLMALVGILAASFAVARTLSVVDYGLVVPATIALCVLYAAANQLMANGPHLKTIGTA